MGLASRAVAYSRAVPGDEALTVFEFRRNLGTAGAPSALDSLTRVAEAGAL